MPVFRLKIGKLQALDYPHDITKSAAHPEITLYFLLDNKIKSSQRAELIKRAVKDAKAKLIPSE